MTTQAVKHSERPENLLIYNWKIIINVHTLTQSIVILKDYVTVFQALTFQKIGRIITSVDSQPMFDGGVLINVLGRLQVGIFFNLLHC